MLKFLITGANGFCGRHLVDVLVDSNNSVYGISRSIPDDLIAQHPTVTYEQCNLIDHTSVYNMLKKIKKAQSILEYAMIIAIVAAALMAMNVYVQRSIQANLKMIEDRVNAGPAK